MKLNDLTGQKFYRLTVVSRAPTRKHTTRWECECECGNRRIVGAAHLITGHTRSCGCLGREITISRSMKHGHKTRAKTSREYEAWRGAKARTSRINHKRFADWGGRGIRMCEEWRDNFEQFLADMGPCPPGYSLDRIDNDGNYEPINCRWSSPTQQNTNQRPRRRGYKKQLGRGYQHSHFITYNDRTLNVTEWASLMNLPRGTFYARVRRQWPLEKIFKELPPSSQPL